jgi:ABC-2 type transport system ATP-binding protein
MAHEAAVQVDGLVVQRGKREVLRSLSCAVPRGAVTGLLGPSGSGKTTMLRAVVGVQKIHSGVVRVLGQSAGSAGLRRQVGYVTQSPSIYRDLTVAQNVAYFAAIAGADRVRINEVMEQVGLGSAAGQLVATLSGGQAGRVSLACALVADPLVLVLDEPTVGLDPVLRVELWNLFHQLADAGASLLVSSHVMDEAGRCDQLLLLREGELLAAETPDVLRQRAGTDDLEEAFLRLIRAGGGKAVAA